MPSATAPNRRPSSSTCATGCRASSPRCAVTGRRWGRTTPWRGSTTMKRGAGSASSSSGARRSRRPASRCSNISPKSNMRSDTLDLLRCQCCIFPVIDGIPVLHLQPAAVTALDQMKTGRADLARRTMFGLDDDRRAEAFDAVAASGTATYRDTVDALGPNFEGGYFLYRFSDPTYLVAQAVVRAVASTVLGGSRRAVDICGGSGHVTRTLMDLTSAPPVLADLYFAKVWLARRLTAPGCEPV